MKRYLMKVARTVCCHRAAYAGLAGAYGALCLGADKDTVNHCLTALYATLAVLRH